MCVEYTPLMSARTAFATPNQPYKTFFSILTNIPYADTLFLLSSHVLFTINLHQLVRSRLPIMLSIHLVTDLMSTVIFLFYRFLHPYPSQETAEDERTGDTERAPPLRPVHAPNHSLGAYFSTRNCSLVNAVYFAYVT